MNQIERTVLVDLLHNPSSTVHQILYRNQCHSMRSVEAAVRTLQDKNFVSSRTAAEFLTISERGYHHLIGGRE
jgi:hypothetical protein